MNNNLPYKLFIRAIFIHLLLFISGFLILKFLMPKVFTEVKFYHVYFYFLFFSLLSLIIIFWYTLKPLTKLINSLKGLVENQNFSEDQLSDAMAYENTPGEWNDLEVVLKKLVKILRKNFKALSREKIEIQAVMNSVEEPIFAIDQSERVIFYNPAFGMVFGLETGATDLLQAHKVLPDATLLHSMREVLKRGEPLESQLDVVIANQSFTFTLSLSPLKRETDNSTYGVVVVFHDRSLQIETNKKKLDFVANASHELRTPVTMISSAVQLLQRNLNNPEIRDELIENLKENTSRLVGLTEGLLDLSTIESGEKLDLQNINARSCTLKILSTNSFSESRLILDCDENIFLNVDPRRLDQVITNLVTNAFRYSPKIKNIYVIWETSATHVTLRVRDQGAGIPAEHAKRIFERFYRIDAARTRKFGGAGIGLAIVKHIMKLHRGEVSVNLDYTDGAEFVCSFPLNLDEKRI